eukprot:gene2664-5226_t
MGRIYRRFLETSQIYKCDTCSTHLSSNDQVISKAFHGRGGKAYLMNDCVNVYLGPLERRVLITGLHTVADIYCIGCHSVVGWKYEEAYEESQKYKEGKYILEKTKLAKEDW